MRIQGLIAVVGFLVCVYLDFAESCACRYCSTVTGRSLMDQKSVEEARTFDVLFPCCNVCTGTVSLPDITNTKCGIKKTGTRKIKNRRGGNKKNKNKNKNKKNKGRKGNKKKGENNRKGRQDEDIDYTDDMKENTDTKDVNNDDNDENMNDNDENNDDNDDDIDENNDDDIEETSNKKIKKRRGPTKIVGGADATENEYPWIAALTTKTDFNNVYCGGSLIASQWVLTAVHCIRSSTNVDKLASEINVKLGEHDTSSETEPNVINVNVEKIILHPDYSNTDGLLNDVALLKLEKEVDLNIYTPVCLPPFNQKYEGQTATAIGWGTLMDKGELSEILQEVEVNVVPSDTCKTNYAPDPTGNAPSATIVPAMLCAAATGKDSCQGDSGGPLSIPSGDNNQHFQVGITSFGDGCAREGKPGVYADVSFAREFIECTLSTNGGATFVP